MEIMQSISECGEMSKGCILTIGNFDGVHLGHQEILSFALQKAVQRAAKLVAITFEPHPVTILYPEKAPGVLTPLETKQDLLKKCGVDCLIVLRDSIDLLKLSPEDFVHNVIGEHLQPSMVVEGDDFNFGAARAGNIQTLQKLGVEYGFKVHALQSKNITLSTGQVVRVSSTMIRYMLESGHINDANIALGKPYRLIEKIIRGRGIGTKLGFPTLNMQVPSQVIPAEGVYAGFVYLGETQDEVLNSEKHYPAVYSIGQARTYGEENPLLIEAHLFDENVPDIEGKYMAMDFVRHIRNQHKFRSPSELSAQISKDCVIAKNILNNQ